MQTLELLGLSPKELDVYLATLRLGTAPLRRVAEESGYQRATVYDALKHLREVGLVRYVDAKTHRYFTGEDPHKLRGIATRREVALTEAREGLEKILPSFVAMQGTHECRPAVRYYEGPNGVRDLLEDVLSTAEHAESKAKLYRVYSSAGIRDLILQAWPTFTKERIRRGVRVRAIAIGEGGSTTGLDERKWLRKDATSPTYIFLCATKTAYVSLAQDKELFGVIINDPAVAKTEQCIFDALWNTLP